MSSRKAMEREKLATAMTAIVEKAGHLAAKDFRLGKKTSAEIWYKDGGSPVTAADIAANDLLQTELQRLLPEAAWLSEETADSPERLGKDLVWIIDPIDGTRAFLTGHGDWCVCVALLEKGIPVIGNVYAPAIGKHYRAIHGQGALCNAMPLNVSPTQRIKGSLVAGPVPMIAALQLKTGPVQKVDRIPSLALRLVRVAEGSIDIGLVSGMSRDWDIAAADLILREAGGSFTDIRGDKIQYNNPRPTHGELAASSKLLHASLIEALN